MVLQVWIDPLSVEVDTGHRISVVTTDHAVWIEDWDEDEGVEFPEELGLLLI